MQKYVLYETGNISIRYSSLFAQDSSIGCEQLKSESLLRLTNVIHRIYYFKFESIIKSLFLKNDSG